MEIKVQHVESKDDWGKPKDGSSSWIEYWKKHSGYKLQDFCWDCKRKISDDNSFVGAHVKKVESNDMDIYIVPVCNECNSRGKDCHEFKCEKDILVPANKENLKGK